MDRQLEAGLPESLKQVVSERIADIHLSMAYEHRQRGDFPVARRHYLEGMRARFDWKLVRGWLGTFRAVRTARVAVMRLLGRAYQA